MSHEVPKLIGLSGSDVGSLLLLDDHRQVEIDVAPNRLREILSHEELTDFGSVTLDELIERRSVNAIVGHIEMTAEQWDTIRRIVQSSPQAAAALSRFPTLRTSFDEPFDRIAARPHRLYGGLSHRMFTSFPIDFRGNPNRPPSWRHACLNAPGGWLLSTWVNLGTGEVEIELEQRPGHFVE